MLYGVEKRAAEKTTSDSHKVLRPLDYAARSSFHFGFTGQEKNQGPE